MIKPKILYAIQGTGNGHVARALEIIPLLKKHAKVEVFLSGDQNHLALPFKIHKKSKGFVFVYNKGGGISYLKTLLKNNPIRILYEIATLPVKNYDLVINDFEFISAWSCKLKNVKSVALSHQSALLFKECPTPKFKDRLGWFILKNYAPTTHAIGFHFKKYNCNTFTPVIRNRIRSIESHRGKHYTVYLPAYSKTFLIQYLEEFNQKLFQVFTKEVQEITKVGHLTFYPINEKTFTESFANCRGIITSAGFETPAEAIFMNKKLLVVPIKGQYEQWMNATALKTMGIEVIYQLNDKTKMLLYYWLKEEKKIHIKYPDETENIITHKILPLITSLDWGELSTKSV